MISCDLFFYLFFIETTLSEWIRAVCIDFWTTQIEEQWKHVTEQLKYNFWSMTLQHSFLGANLTLPAALGIILERSETKSSQWL